MPPPSQVLSTRLAAPPAAVWARLTRSDFIAAYLGAQLPAQRLGAGSRLMGQDADGRALQLTVTQWLAPCSLSVRVQDAAGCHALRWSIAPCDGGSRLVVQHESAAEASAAQDGIAALLSREPAAVLVAPRIADAAALALARDYLADTARAVTALRQALPPRAGHARPAADRFSLAEQLWHLADVEEFGWTPRFCRVLAGPDAVLAGVDGDRLARERRYRHRPWRGAARRFIAQRRRTLAALARFDAALLARPLHFGGAASDAGALLAAMLAHDHEHRQEMAWLWTAANHDGTRSPHRDHPR